MRAVIFMQRKIFLRKLSQALDTARRRCRLPAIFDDAMHRVQQVARKLAIYLVIAHPFRLEGQKTIMFRILEALRWDVPDWIVCPAGT